MSLLGDVLGFESFQVGDWLKKAKKNPEQLLLGAADPLGAKVWGGITGKDYEPFVDQMGGAYGGHPLSFGKGAQDGGVYGRAREAGINTGAGGRLHDVAHLVAAYYGGAGLGNAAGNLTGGTQAITPSQAAAMNLPESAATLPEGAGAGGGFSWESLFKQGGMPGGGGGQQQSAAAPAAPAADPNEQARKRAALLSMGLGMLSRSRGGMQMPWGMGIGSTGGL